MGFNYWFSSVFNFGRDASPRRPPLRVRGHHRGPVRGSLPQPGLYLQSLIVFKIGSPQGALGQETPLRGPARCCPQRPGGGTLGSPAGLHCPPSGRAQWPRGHRGGRAAAASVHSPASAWPLRRRSVTSPKGGLHPESPLPCALGAARWTPVCP